MAQVLSFAETEPTLEPLTVAIYESSPHLVCASKTTSMTPLAAADHVCQGGLSCIAGHVVKAISQLRFLTQ